MPRKQKKARHNRKSLWYRKVVPVPTCTCRLFSTYTRPGKKLIIFFRGLQSQFFGNFRGLLFKPSGATFSILGAPLFGGYLF